MSSKRLIYMLSVGGILAILLFIGMPLAYFMNGGWDYEISLPGNYCLVRIHSNNVALCVASGNRLEIIGANIERYAVLQHIVVGHVVAVSPDELGEDEPGYFLFDTRTSKVWKGLSEQQWMVQLRKHGIFNKPDMRRPTRPIRIGPFKIAIANSGEGKSLFFDCGNYGKRTCQKEAFSQNKNTSPHALSDPSYTKL